MKLLLATNNTGKVREFQDLLTDGPYEITTPRQVSLALSVEETGATLEENALLKAIAFRNASGLISLADDSGLFVDALGGEPGVHSARYAGPNASDEDRVRLLLERLKGVPPAERTASFRCVIAIATPSEGLYFARGECQGIISLQPAGKNGFGYDPVFLFPETRRTMAELSVEEKAVVSHRGHAARVALVILKDLAKSEGAPRRPMGRRT